MLYLDRLSKHVGRHESNNTDKESIEMDRMYGGYWQPAEERWRAALLTGCGLLQQGFWFVVCGIVICVVWRLGAS